MSGRQGSAPPLGRSHSPRREGRGGWGPRSARPLLAARPAALAPRMTVYIPGGRGTPASSRAEGAGAGSSRGSVEGGRAPSTRALPCQARGPGYALPHGARCRLLGAPEGRGLGLGAAGMRGGSEGKDRGEEAWVVTESSARVKRCSEWALIWMGKRSHEGPRLELGHSCAILGGPR